MNEKMDTKLQKLMILHSVLGVKLLVLTLEPRRRNLISECLAFLICKGAIRHTQHQWKEKKELCIKHPPRRVA